jgi:hypothetical protein
MCGRQAVVFRSMHRLFDYRKTRRMRRMESAVLLCDAVCDGSGHGGCDAACQTIWKASWLRRVDAPASQQRTARRERRVGRPSRGLSPPPADDASSASARLFQTGTQPPRYACQLTELHAASAPVRATSVVELLRPLVAGNVTPAAFVVGWLTHLFNLLQHYRGGSSYPALELVPPAMVQPEAGTLRQGQHVVVRPASEIKATLKDGSYHRGLYFEPDMLKHCGRRYCVASEVRRIIDIVSGEMITMKTPAYILDDVRFSGERQLFNAQCEPLYWRSVWLRGDAG